MLVENGGFLNSNAYTQCFVKSRILPCSVPFLINMKKTKKTSRHQVLAGEWSHVWGSIGFQLSTLNITLFVALTCVW